MTEVGVHEYWHGWHDGIRRQCASWIMTDALSCIFNDGRGRIGGWLEQDYVYQWSQL